jgi:hypothetical protein
MKRTLLLSFILTSGLSYGQSNYVNKPAEEAIKSTKLIYGVGPNVQPSAPASEPKSAPTLDKFARDVYDFVPIGTSFYDLQTNASIGRRTVLHSDGTISAVWTYSPDPTTGWPNRGTAYNYYDGSAWGTAPSARVDSDRTGWPSIGVLEDGSEYVVGHISSDGGLIISKNSGKGMNDWSSASPILQETNRVSIWNRTANHGDTLHALTNYFSDEDGGIDEVVIDKITNPTTYSRSFDGGATWEDLHILLPGYDSSRYLNGGGDAYAIDVRGSIVAIVIGGVGRDLSLWKSNNSGTDWTKTVVDSFAFSPYDFDKLISEDDVTANPSPSNDGSMDVIIDADGNAHVTFGRVAVADDDVSDENFFLFESVQLFYWNESSQEIVECGTLIDMDGTVDENGDQFTITGETTASLSNGAPPGTLSYAAQYGLTSIATHPSMSIDDQGRIFVIYDAPVEQIVHDYGANFRDIHIVYSTDGGASWSDEQNATQIRRGESVFGCLTKRTDDFVHFIFQNDPIPGTHLQNNGNTGLHPNEEATIYYAAIPVSDILAGNLGNHNLNTDDLAKEANIHVVSQNFPNPFSNETAVTIYLSGSSDVELEVTDMTGKVVSSFNFGHKNAGNHRLVINGSSLNEGVYFYTLKTEDSKVTKKMQIVR